MQSSAKGIETADSPTIANTAKFVQPKKKRSTIAVLTVENYLFLFYNRIDFGQKNKTKGG